MPRTHRQAKDAQGLQPPGQRRDFQLCNGVQVLGRQALKDDDVVQPVEELGRETLLERVYVCVCVGGVIG